MSALAVLAGMTGCKDAQNVSENPFAQEKQVLKEAIKHRSPDVQSVEIVGDTLVYTHIADGVVDIKTYVFDNDVCVEAERVYVFPDQMSALRHYRRAVEQAELYDDIQMMKNKVKYDLKKDQYKLETKGLTKEQLKAKFEKQISDAKADMHRHNEKMKADLKRDGQYIENDMKCCGKKDCKDRK